MLENIQVLCHSSIKMVRNGKIIYFNPFKIDRNRNDADYIFVTHSHYDHFSEEDILKVKKENSVIVVTNDLIERTQDLGFDIDNIITVTPDKEYNISGIKFRTVRAYNENKDFHPKDNNWVGYILELDGYKYYIAGDTDITEDNKKVSCDVAFIPIGGTYTMDINEAANLIEYIKPKVVVPTHYGTIVGEKDDGLKFKKIVNSNVECKILI